MEISLIYVLIIAEVMLMLIALSITLVIVILRKPKPIDDIPTLTDQQADDEFNAVEPGNSYIDFLDQAIQRNTSKAGQQKNIEEDIESSAQAAETIANEEDSTQSPAPDETQSCLLHARKQFLLMEKAAAEKTEHEINFWDSIYDGMKNLIEKFSSTEYKQSSTNDEEKHKTESKEKIFYIETQGKKIDGEVNKLKDIIYEQENALSSMLKTMKAAESEHPEGSELLTTLTEHVEAIERQLSDSKMCMEVLELENNRLHEEVAKMDARHDALFNEDGDDENDNDSTIDLDQMKEMVSEQEDKIQHLIETIESLELDATKADALKSTISDFARTSKEMMSCICILEEENDRLKTAEHENKEEPGASDTGGADTNVLKDTISELEENLIKKDVAYAQLQDEFSSMETEYLAMYEAMHGDNS